MRTADPARAQGTRRPQSMAAIAPFLEPHATVHALDRRVEVPVAMLRSTAWNGEYEDVAAVVDAVAVTSGEQVDVYGHSHGRIVPFGAATLAVNIRRLVLNKGWPVPDHRSTPSRQML